MLSLRDVLIQCQLYFSQLFVYFISFGILISAQGHIVHPELTMHLNCFLLSQYNTKIGCSWFDSTLTA